MPLSRRRFLGMTAAVPLALPQRLAGKGRIFGPDLDAPRCLLVEAGERCVLQESLSGFARGLAAASIRFERVSVQTIRHAQLVIVPGAVCDSRTFAKAIRRLTDSGSAVLYESGAAYADLDAFEIEKGLLRDYFGLSLEPPRELWKPEAGRPPYVEYHWPSSVMIRDFSRLIAVRASASELTPIARIGKTVVACHRPVGKGALIFLGSSLGPHLAFGDREAQRLLESFVFSQVSSFPRKRESSLWTTHFNKLDSRNNGA
jgi:hypothetical protein